MPMRVLFVPYREKGSSDPKMLPRWKRRWVWRNDARNSALGELAKGFAMKPKRTLAALVVDEDFVKLPRRSELRVLLLAETAEHADRLSEFCPDWRVDSVRPQPDGDFLDPPARRIATLTHAYEYGPCAHVVVRATGGTGKLFEGWSYEYSAAQPLLIVDLDDATPVRPAREAADRRREYREMKLRIAPAVPRG